MKKAVKEVASGIAECGFFFGYGYLLLRLRDQANPIFWLCFAGLIVLILLMVFEVPQGIWSHMKREAHWAEVREAARERKDMKKLIS